MTVDVTTLSLDLFAPDLEEDSCDPLDDLIVTLLIARTAQARRHRAARREAGLPARTMASEYAMVKRFTARLGPRGAEIAQVVLALTHSAELTHSAQEPPRAG
ncbi:hypothetical protein [Couchioplanes caeruleus]|uniref:Chorismate mutase n=2 Tax=Couchioplanes caeruleus TaxID=56438 RepID=A0A1K0FTZ3_9ACTN|nr:hypothetical protein [Couchioplanes caeruleus]OJF16265.1 hypothetical protein BG844_00040 [Couchioplanes caeruleus subsp. caeruleus]ROP28381.1 hypothetical protein EDD30_1136 [Couchioplanes caeruleus]